MERNLQDIFSMAVDKAYPVFDAAVDEIMKNYKGEEATEKTKRSVVLMGIFKGLLQAKAHNDGVRYQVIRDISKDPEEIKKYVTISLPQVNPVKKLK